MSARLAVTGAGPTRTVAESTSGADGSFRLPLPPGGHTIHPANLICAVAPVAQPVTVTVTSGQFTAVVIRFASGIR